jgi:ubiquitin carboxyl-terminal hydrolase 7
MEYIRNNMAARATDLRLYLDYNPDMTTFNKVSWSKQVPQRQKLTLIAPRRPTQPAHHDLPQMVRLLPTNTARSRETLGLQEQQGQRFATVYPGKDGLAKLDANQIFRGKSPICERDPRLICQEIKAGMIESMKLKQTYATNEIQDGDIICYQVEITPKE